MNDLKLKCSQMSLSDLEALRRVIVENYNSLTKSSSISEEDVDGLRSEERLIYETVSEALLNKATAILYT